MGHLTALRRAGLTDIHLLPVYDIGSVRKGCADAGARRRARQRGAAGAGEQTADTDCFNWGYDPFHYNAPEGSYATDPSEAPAASSRCARW